jgi:hypothetical protein
MRVDKFEHANEWHTWIGKEVVKHSGKPFKSGEQIGSVVAFTTNPHSGKPAFEMNDGSVVDCFQVKLNQN